MLNDSRNHLNQARVANYTYKISAGQRYYIIVKIKDINGTFKPVRILADSGNDITILTKSTAMALGYDTPTMTDVGSFSVKGINGKAAEFKEISADVIVGKIPLKIPIGLATADADLSDNLLGRTGVLDSGKIGFNFDNDSVDVVDKRAGKLAQGMKVSVCGGGGRC